MIQVREIINSVYRKAGNLSREQLPLPVVMEYLYDIIDRRLTEFGLHENDYLLKQAAEQQVSSSDIPLGVSDFANIEQIDVRFDAGSSYTTIDRVSFSEIDEAADQGRLAYAIYGNPPRLRLSLQSGAPIFLRIWYTPETIQQRGLDQSVILSAEFRNLITTELLLMVIDEADLAPERISAIQQKNLPLLQRLEELWEQKLMASRIAHGAVRRRPFRAR